MFRHRLNWFIVVLAFLALYLLRSQVIPQQVYAANPTMIVTSTGNGADADPTDGICSTASGQCTLRAAVQQANAASGEDRIEFDPTITDITINNLTINDSDPLTIDGKGAVTIRQIDSNAEFAFRLNSSNNQVMGLNIVGFPTAIKVNGDDNRLQNLVLSAQSGNTPTGHGIDIFGGGTYIDLVEVSGKSIGIYAEEAGLYTNQSPITIQESKFNGNDIAINSTANSQLISLANTFTDNVSAAIIVYGGKVDIQGNEFFNNPVHVDVTGVTEGIVSYNHLRDGGKGISLAYATNVEVTDNYFESVESIALEIKGESRNITISANDVIFSSVALRAIGVSNSTIESNRMMADKHVAAAHFMFISQSSNNSIHYNLLKGNGAAKNGIYVTNEESSANSVDIANNTLFGFTESHIYVENMADINLNHNNVGVNSGGSYMTGRDNGRGILLKDISGGSVHANLISNTKMGFYLDTVTDIDFTQNFIGTDFTGTRSFGNKGLGIYLKYANNLNFKYNVISANQGHGVFVATPSQAINIERNIIGLSADGLEDLGNHQNGIFVSGNEVRDINIWNNTISGNNHYGIWVQNGPPAGGGTNRNIQIRQNYIGSSHNSEAALGNSDGGIFVGNAEDILIDENVIAGNRGYGIELSSGTKFVDITTNFIGQTYPLEWSIIQRDAFDAPEMPAPELAVDGDGTPLGNEEDGIYVHGATDQINIGSDACVERTDWYSERQANDAWSPIHNAFSSQNGTFYAQCLPDGHEQSNVIAFNKGNGVRINDAGYAIINVNSIHSNDELAINLQGDPGVDPLHNGTGNGANHLLSAIKINRAAPRDISYGPISDDTDNYMYFDGKFFYVAYDSYLADTRVGEYFVDFYFNSTCDESGHGEAEIFLARAFLYSSDRNEHQVEMAFRGEGYITAIVNIPGLGTSEVSNCDFVDLGEPRTPLVATQGSGLEREVCTLTTIADPTNLRVGPGEDRGIFTSLPSGRTLSAISQLSLEDGSEWWQINREDVAGGLSANELWLYKGDVNASGCGDIPEGEAPPVIVPIVPTLTPVPIVTTQPNSGPAPDNNPPPCYSVSVSHQPSPWGSVSLSASNCPGGYEPGTNVSVQATPTEPGAILEYWDGSCVAGQPTSGSLNFTITQSCTLTAHWLIVN